MTSGVISNEMKIPEVGQPSGLLVKAVGSQMTSGIV